jgi:hypothetical protein
MQASDVDVQPYGSFVTFSDPTATPGASAIAARP